MEEAYTVRIVYQYGRSVLCLEREAQSIVGFAVLFGDREPMWKEAFKGRLKETGADSSQQLEMGRRGRAQSQQLDLIFQRTWPALSAPLNQCGASK